MTLLIALLILFVLTISNYVITRDYLHPSVVQSGMWMYQLLGLIVFHDLFIETSTEAIIVILVGAITFTIGAHLPLDAAIGRNLLVSPRGVRRNLNWFWVSLLVIGISSYGQYQIFVDLSEGGDLAATLMNIRTFMSEEREDVYGAFKYGTTLAFGALLLLQILISRSGADSTRRLLFVLVLFFTGLLAFFSTGRGQLVQIILLLGLSYLLGRKKRWLDRNSGFVLLVAVVLTFLIFWLMGNAMGKAAESAVDAILDVVAYQMSSIPALSIYLAQHDIPFLGGDLGAGTFRLVFAVMASAGLMEQPPSLAQEFVSVPHLTNIYTVYLLPIRDFGWLGVVLMSLFLGAVHGNLFRWAMHTRENEFAFYLLVISYLPLLQSTGGDAYFSLMAYWIQLLLIGIVLTVAHKKSEHSHDGR